jgi:hypothetical protein
MMSLPKGRKPTDFQVRRTFAARDLRVPFDNNEAERVITMSKLRIKVSGCMRSMKGARGFCAVRSCLATVARHGTGWPGALTQAAAGTPRVPQTGQQAGLDVTLAPGPAAPVPAGFPRRHEYACNLAPLAVQRILEQLMNSSTWPGCSPFAKEQTGRPRRIRAARRTAPRAGTGARGRQASSRAPVPAGSRLRPARAPRRAPRRPHSTTCGGSRRPSPPGPSLPGRDSPPRTTTGPGHAPCATGSERHPR